MVSVNWPKGYIPIYHKIRSHAVPILTGTVCAIDPASGGSSNPGFAVFRAGELLTSGEIELPRKTDIYLRLQALYDKINKLAPDGIDVLAIEEIRGQNFSHHHLRWAIGVSIAAARSPITIEIPLNVWKALAKATPGYIKGDAMDAEMIGTSTVMLARKLSTEQAS